MLTKIGKKDPKRKCIMWKGIRKVCEYDIDREKERKRERERERERDRK